MKKMLFFICLLIMCGLRAGHLQAQDVIVKKDGTIMTVYNLEESANNYFYSLDPSSNADLKKIRKDDVFSVKKSDGTTIAQPGGNVDPKPQPKRNHEVVTAEATTEIKTDRKGNKTFYAQTPDGHQLNYAILSEEEHTVMVTSGNYKEKEYVIPENIKVGEDIYTVTEIGKGCFVPVLRGQGPRKIQFPYTLKKIGFRAFYGCSLEEIILPEGLESIEVGAFQSIWTIIKEIYVPSSLKEMGMGCFLECGLRHSPNGYCQAYFSNLPSFITEGNCSYYGIDDSAVEAFQKSQR